MSLNFSQITELIDTTVKSNPVSYPLAKKTVDINLALDHALAIIFETDGRWQFDDGNHADYPIITTDLVDGRRDYSFVSDERGNLILDIYKVLIKPSATLPYQEIEPVDVNSQHDTQGFTDGQDAEGVPCRYDKLANGIFLDPIPSYNATAGLKIYINREASYFAEQDTTKKPGIAGLFHEYLALRPAYQYAYRNSLKNTAAIQGEVLRLEQGMREYYARREKDVHKQITTKPIPGGFR